MGRDEAVEYQCPILVAEFLVLVALRENFLRKQGDGFDIRSYGCRFENQAGRIKRDDPEGRRLRCGRRAGLCPR